jgi:hypothetical protein
MGTMARTPEHYPRMKVRGDRRRRLAPWQRLRRTNFAAVGAITSAGLTTAQAADAFAKLTAVLGPFVPRTPEVQARLAAYYDGRGADSKEDCS